MSRLHELEDVLNACSRYLTNQESIEMIKDAYYFMEEKHKDQYRKSGEPYKYHLIEVAYMIHPYEYSLLLEEDFRQSAAESIKKGIINFLIKEAK